MFFTRFENKQRRGIVGYFLLRNNRYKGATKWINLAYFLVCVSCLIYFGSKIVCAGDPSGESTYSDSIEGLKYSINMTWTLVAAFLLFSMQAGFAFLGGFL